MPVQRALALDPHKALSQYVHTVWRTDEGLPQNSVTKILETSDGYLWVGTQAGLARFDGVRFTVFDHTNTPALANDSILDLVEDTRGVLWVATASGGVVRFEDGTFFHVDAIGARGGRALAADADGSMWIGGYGGLGHLKGGRVVRHYSAAEGLSGDPVTSVLADRDGSVWIASNGGLNRLARGAIQSYAVKDSRSSTAVSRVYAGTDGVLSVLTQNGVLRLQGGTLEAWGIPDTGSVMLQDRDGSFWFSSTAGGLLRDDGKQVTRFTTRQGLSGDDVSALYEDRDGNLWVGTNNGGLDRFRDGSFTNYAKEEGLAGDSACSVMEDRVGDVWVTTALGLNRLRGGAVRVFDVADGLPSDNVWALLEDGQHRIWAGTSTSGLFRMDNGRFSRIVSARDGLPPYQISAVIEDRASHLWVGTRGGGLVAYASGRLTIYARKDGLSSDFINDIEEDDRGRLWIGTTGGLNSISAGRITRHVIDSARPDLTVSVLYIDATRTLWVGTLGRGLFRLQDNRFVRYAAKQGLPDDSINNILEDTTGNVWIGSNKGIFRVARAELDAVAAGTRPAVQPVVFGKADGMKTNETCSGIQPSGWRARDGRLWFPTGQGVVVVDPARIALSRLARRTRIEGLLVDEAPVALRSPIRLAPGTRRLEIRYTAPNLSSPQRTKFRYRLDGFDDAWTIATGRRVAEYTNLSPGHYAFRVSASSDTGEWSRNDSVLDFQILPRYYQSWWFRALVAIGSVATAAWFYRLRVGWLHSRAAVMEERQRIAGDIHDNLAQGLSGIIFQSDAALISLDRSPASTQAHLVAIREHALSSLNEAWASVWNLSSPGMHDKSLLEAISTMAQQLASGRLDAVDVRSTGDPWTLPPAVENHIVRIAQEALSNAIQHGEARMVSITLDYSGKGLRLQVTDNGSGFAASSTEHEPGRGFGLGNMRRRAGLLGARFDIDSSRARHTTVTLWVPKGNLLLRLWHRVVGMGSTESPRG